MVTDPRLRLFLLLLAMAGCTRGDAVMEELEASSPFFDLAAERFPPVYESLARQFLQDSGVTRGISVDIGGGAGGLALEMARSSELTVYVLDSDPSSVALGTLLARRAGLAERVRPVLGDATDLPFRDGFADLVVSRGSIFFWDDQLGGLTEAWRIMAPGSTAYIGGGFSRILAQEDPETYQALVEWRRGVSMEETGWKPLEPDLVERAREAGLAVRVDSEPEVGAWLVLEKPAAEGPVRR